MSSTTLGGSQWIRPFENKLHLLDSSNSGRTISEIPADYGPVQAAEDAVLLLDALNIQQVHLFGVAMGTLTAMHVSILHPTRTLSLFLLSPMSLREPDFILTGRAEIADCWQAGFTNPDAWRDTAHGAMQLATANEPDKLLEAMLRYDFPSALRLYPLGNMRNYRTVFASFFSTERREKYYSKHGFSRVRCPVKLVYGLHDIAYTLEQAEEVLGLLREANVGVGVQASLETLPAHHFGHIGQGEEINKLFSDFMQEMVPEAASLPVPSLPGSPFEGALRVVDLSSSPPVFFESIR